MGSGTYDDLRVHRVMLRDDVRNQAYRRAIFATVKKGDVVLDVGAGTGILSLFAAQAGAGIVYAVERTGIADLARRMAAKNGFADRVEIIQGDMGEIRLPQSVDVIISEWLGAYGVDENMLLPVLTARDRWLKPSGKMLPERVTAWMAPVCDDSLSDEKTFFQSRPYEIDFSLITNDTSHELRWTQHAGDHFPAEPQPMWMTDVYACTVEDARLPFRASLSFAVTREQEVNALIIWFNAEFGMGVTLANAPGAPRTHWGQYVFPLKRAASVGPGERIAVEFTCIPTGQSYCHHAWSVRIGNGSWEHHDTRMKI